MLTQFFLGINWVDVALSLLLIRVIFIGVKAGFLTEFVKFLGVIVAVFVSFHYYSYISAHIIKMVYLPVAFVETSVFILLWVLITVLFWFLRFGLGFIFKAETTNENIDKYAGGFIAVARALLLFSLVIFMLLLTRHPYLGRQTLNSVGYKLAGRTGVHLYHVFCSNIFEKIFEGQHFNQATVDVINGQAQK